MVEVFVSLGCQRVSVGCILIPGPQFPEPLFCTLGLNFRAESERIYSIQGLDGDHHA